MLFEGLTIYQVLLVLLLSIALLFYAHFLHSRRKHVVVPTLYFWRQVSSGILSNKLSDKFRNVKTFIFLLLIVLVFCAALLRPVKMSESQREYILIFDCRSDKLQISKEFRANCIEGTKEWCKSFFKNVNNHDKLSLISVTDEVRYYSGVNNIKHFTHDVLDSLYTNGALNSTGFLYAMETAGGMVEANPEARAIVISCKAIDEAIRTKFSKSFTFINPIIGDRTITRENTGDLETEIVKLYTEIDLPYPLRCFIDSHSKLTLTDTKSSSDVVITDEDDIRNDISQIILVSYVKSEQYSDLFPAFSLVNECDMTSINNAYVKAEKGFKLVNDNVFPYVYHSYGDYLAAGLRNDGYDCLYLSESLFADESTFWKQDIFVSLMTEIIEKSLTVVNERLINTSNGKSTTVEIEDITTEVGSQYETAVSTDIFYSLCLLICILLVLECYLYNKKVIV